MSFFADHRRQSVPWQNDEIIGQREQAASDPGDQGLMVAISEIGAANNATKQCIAHNGEFVFATYKDDMARRMSRAMRNFQGQPRQRDGLSIFHKPIGMRVLQIVKSKGLRLLDDGTQQKIIPLVGADQCHRSGLTSDKTFTKRVGTPSMIEMPVRQQNGVDCESLEHLQELGNITARIEHHSVSGLLILENRTILAQGGHLDSAGSQSGYSLARVMLPFLAVRFQGAIPRRGRIFKQSCRCAGLTPRSPRIRVPPIRSREACAEPSGFQETIMSRIIRTEPNPVMSKAVEYHGFIFTQGVVARNLDADFDAQTADVLEQLDILLEQHGTDNTRILQAQIWLKEISDRDALNKQWTAWLPKESAPARACVQAVLADPRMLVEIMLITTK